MIEAIVEAEKFPGISAATGEIIARPIKAVCDHRQLSRDHPFFDWSGHPERQIGFTLTETDLACLADEFDAQAGMLSLKWQKTRREKLREQRRRPVDPYNAVWQGIDGVGKARDIGNARFDLPDAIANLLALGGQTVRARQPLDDPDTEIMFEHVDPPRHGGMIDPEFFRRARKAAGFGQREKEFQVVPVHAQLRINAPSLRRNARSAAGDGVRR